MEWPDEGAAGAGKIGFVFQEPTLMPWATVAANVPSRVYNIGSGIGQTLNDFAAVLRKKIPGAAIEIGPGLNFLGMPYQPHGIYDVTRAREELGFKAEYDLERAIDDYLDSLKRMQARGA